MNGADCAGVRPLARPTAVANILNMPWKGTRSPMRFSSKSLLSQTEPYVRLPPKATAVVRRNELACCADFVAEVFCPSECVRLIQDQASMRNVDSRIHSPRFDCCVFLFYSFSAV